jgi:hypothetical protein
MYFISLLGTAEEQTLFEKRMLRTSFYERNKQAGRNCVMRSFIIAIFASQGMLCDLIYQGS